MCCSPWGRKELDTTGRLNSMKGNTKECSKYCIVALFSHAIKIMVKIFQAGLQQCVDQVLPDIQAGFQRETRDQIVDIHWILEIAMEFQENIYSAFLSMLKL